MLRIIYSFLLKRMGWTFEGDFEPRPSKFIVIVAPHTSNLDFVIGVMARSKLRLTSTKYLGKSQLFRFPYGFIFRALGGYPVDRTKHNNLVDAVVELFNSKEKFSIALAPEGTRSKVDRIKTGFYHIAKKVNIPIFLVGFDYGRKTIVIKEPMWPGGSALDDFRTIIQFYSTIQGKQPELGVTMELFERMKEQIETQNHEE